MTRDLNAPCRTRSGAKPSVGSSVLLSVAGHFLLFAVLLFGQHFSSNPPFDPSMLNVTMVTLQSPGPPPPLEESGDAAPVVEEPAPEPAPEPEPAPKPPEPESKKTVAIEKPPPEPEKKAPVAEKKTYRSKESLKKKTYKAPSKVVQQAIERLEKNLDETEPDPLQSALDRLRKKVDSTPAKPKAETPKKPKPGGSPKGVPGGTGSEGGKQAELIDLYRMEIAMQIQQNWAFSEQMARLGSDLKASLVFKVMPNGEIEDVFFTDRSGNRYLDESAYKAIMKSNPVKPHPPGLLAPYVSVGLRFTPEGIR